MIPLDRQIREIICLRADGACEERNEVLVTNRARVTPKQKVITDGLQPERHDLVITLNRILIDHCIPDDCQLRVR